MCIQRNVHWHILAPPAVACDIIVVRRSVHPVGGFLHDGECNFLSYKNRQLLNTKSRLLLS